MQALRGELTVIDRTIEAARRQRVAAGPAVWRAIAAEKRHQAEQLASEADQRQKRTDKLLAELREFEGCEYTPAAPRPRDIVSGAAIAGRRTDDRWRSRRLRQRLLRSQVRQIEAEATELEGRKVQQSGSITGTREEVLAAIQASDPMKLVPTLPSVLAFMAAGEPQVRERRARVSPYVHSEGYRTPDAPLAYDLAWKDGALDLSRSKVREPGQ